MEKPIYPAVECNIKNGLIGHTEMRNSAQDAVSIELKTFLRKKHNDGLYYLVEFKKDVTITKADYILIDSMQTQDIFHAEIYNFITLGKIDPNLILDNIEQRKAFTLDPDQTPEEERLRKLIDV